MQIRVDIYITAAGATRAFLLRAEGGAYPEVIGVGRSVPAAVRDFADCFNAVQSSLPEGERVSLSPSDVLPSRRIAKHFAELWELFCCKNGK